MNVDRDVVLRNDAVTPPGRHASVRWSLSTTRFSHETPRIPAVSGENTNDAQSASCTEAR
jgi:hypothetical protein